MPGFTGNLYLVIYPVFLDHKLDCRPLPREFRGQNNAQRPEYFAILALYITLGLAGTTAAPHPSFESTLACIKVPATVAP